MLAELELERDIFTIGDFATRYGVSAEAIRKWERRGILPPASRTPGGHRRYGVEHRRALDKYIVPCVTDELDDRD